MKALIFSETGEPNSVLKQKFHGAGSCSLENHATNRICPSGVTLCQDHRILSDASFRHENGKA